MSVELFDTHAHLHFPDFDADRAETLARARQAGVTRVLTIGTEVPTSRAAIALAESEPDVWAAVGVHPHDAAEADVATRAEIERLAGAVRVAAVGEIGLDFFRNLSPRDAQERVFRHLIGVARRARKPVLVHCRDAHAEVLAILAEERASEVGGIMHCFSGDVAIAPLPRPRPARLAGGTGDLSERARTAGGRALRARRWARRRNRLPV